MWDTVWNSYPRWESSLAAAQLVLVMLGMGAALRPRDFLHLSRSPGTIGMFAVWQYLGVPALAIGLNRLFGNEPGIALGMIMVAAMPGGPLATLFTLMARGSVAVSVTLTACTTAASLVTVPMMLRGLSVNVVPPDFQMPTEQILTDVLSFLLLPLALGMGIRQWAPRHHGWVARWLPRGAGVILLVIIIGSLQSGRIEPTAYGWKPPTCIIVFCVLSQQLGMLPFRLLRWPSPHRVAVGIELTIRDINLAVLLKAVLLPIGDPATTALANGVLFVVLYYGATSLVAATPLIFIHRWLLRRERRRQATNRDGG